MIKIFSLIFILSLLSLSLSEDVCTVTDESTGHEYDINSLKKTSGDWPVSTPDYNYYFNMCGLKVKATQRVNGVTKECDGNAMACQINNKDDTAPVRSLGNQTALKVVDEGELEYTIYGGAACRGGIQRKVVILLHCNKGAGVGTPVFVHENERCIYVFEWETSAACPANSGTSAPPTTKKCHVIDAEKNLRYDLTALSLTQGNWVAQDQEYGYEYLINICDEVHGVSKCKGFGACQIKPEDPTYAKTLGRSDSVPVLEDGVLKIKMTDGQMCHDTYPRQTVIVFSCREGAGLGKPRFIEESDECLYLFAWESNAACGEPLSEVCTAIDSQTGKQIDISHLAKTQGQENWKARTYVEGDLATYKINVCNTLIAGDHNCRDGSSICQSYPGQTAGRSLGSYGALTVENEEVVLKFTDGDMCPGSNQRVTTTIFMICDPNVVDGLPRLISSTNDCEYLFTWKSSEVCEGASKPPSQKKSVGGIIAIVTVVLVAVGFIFGVLYNRYVKKEKGLYQIPFYDFFQACYYTTREKFTGVGAGAVQL